jgi:L-ascorbate metabolism protein UlaG (beta-lactamase superfamily)
MRLTYIYHSGFAIETHNFTMIIDYYQDSLGDKKGVVYDRLLSRPYRLYVLSTHGHADHFNPEVLEWRERRSDIHYIFSKDIKEQIKTTLDHVIYLDKDQMFKDDLIQVNAFGSTDIGLSYKITTEKKVVFHAGDLNNWHWKEESTDEEVKEAEANYLSELNHIAASTPKLDLAMFPVDPRLGQDYMFGAQQFMEKIPTRLFVPMHFDAEYKKAKAIEEIAKKYNTATFVPSQRGQLFDMEV